jgi:hypothetical protein
VAQGRRHSPEQIAKLPRQIDLSIAGGKSALAACYEAGITDQTFDRWRGAFGNLSLDQIKRMKDLEDENGKLQRMVAEFSLD